MTTIRGRDSWVLLSNVVNLTFSSHRTRELSVCTKLIINTLDNERIRGHSQLQGKHEAFKEVFRQLWDLLRKDLTDEGDELVVLVTQRGELEKTPESRTVVSTENRSKEQIQRDVNEFTLSRS